MATLKRGDKAPAFELADQGGKTIRLADFAGKKLLIYFYPKASTPGCTVQACAVRDAAAELADSSVAAIGISPDVPAAQKKFDDKYGLSFPLLCDEDHAVAETYGVWGEKSMYGKKYMGIIRSAFLVDENGTVAEAWYKISPKETIPSVLAALK